MNVTAGETLDISSRVLIFFLSNSAAPIAWTLMGMSWIFSSFLLAVTIISSTLSSAFSELTLETPNPIDKALSIGLGVSNVNSLKADESVEEIIVTASKKEENIQDIPMSVQAIGAAELDKKNIKTLEDISSVSPAVTFNNVGPGKSNFYIRGVSDGAIMNSYA